jgi:hypothetical protein
MRRLTHSLKPVALSLALSLSLGACVSGLTACASVSVSPSLSLKTVTVAREVSIGGYWLPAGVKITTTKTYERKP